MHKVNYPVERIRHYLEPGPVLLLSSAWRGERDVMTLGWHLVMEFSPSLVGCVISRANHSFGLVTGSGECVLNIPDASLVETVVDIGNCTGAEVDKFERFGLATQPAEQVAAPLLDACFCSLECRLSDERLVESHDFFVFEVLRAHVTEGHPQPRTLHYQGDGRFQVSGRSLDLHRRFRPEML